jgi:glutamate-1-semialdehyde 2,1-aminomutase
MLLVFDEVIAFRVDPHGAQGMFGVMPDLTALGKIIGGGYAVGAFGGSAQIMDRFDARRPGALVHGGTFNGNPVTTAAGLATLRHMTPERFDRLASLGARLRDGLTAGFAATGLDARVTGVASLFQVHLGRGADSASIATGRSGPGDPAAMAVAKTRARRFYLSLLVAGYLTAPRGMGALMTPMSEEDIDGFVAAAVDAAAEALEAVPAG